MAFSIKQQKDTNVLYEVTSTNVLTDDYLVRGDGGVREVQTSLVHLSDTGSVTLPNVQAYRFLDYAGTGYLNVLRGNVDDEVDVGVKLNIGAIEAEEDAGRISIFDMPVSSASADGTQMSATSKIDGNNVFEIGAYADGAGGVDGEYIKSYGAIYRNVTTVNAATYDLLASDDILNVTYTATGAVTSLTLPTAQCVSGRVIVIKDAGFNAGTYSITIDTEAGEKIDNEDTYVISLDGDSVTLVSNGSNWYIL